MIETSKLIELMKASEDYRNSENREFVREARDSALRERDALALLLFSVYAEGVSPNAYAPNAHKCHDHHKKAMFGSKIFYRCTGCVSLYVKTDTVSFRRATVEEEQKFQKTAMKLHDGSKIDKKLGYMTRKGE